LLLQTNDRLRLLHLETGHWLGDFLAAWMTGIGRDCEFARVLNNGLW